MTDSRAVEYLRYQIAPQQTDAFEAAICEAMTLLDVEPTVVALRDHEIGRRGSLHGTDRMGPPAGSNCLRRR